MDDLHPLQLLPAAMVIAAVVALSVIGVDPASLATVALLPGDPSLGPEVSVSTGAEVGALRGGVPSVRSLRVRAPSGGQAAVTARDLAWAARDLDQLESLVLDDCSGLGGDLSFLPRLRSLRVLDLSGCGGLTDAEMRWVGTLTRLRTLRVGRLFQDTPLSDEAVRSVLGARQLRHLVWIGTRITDRGLAALSGQAELRTLDLTASALISDRGVRRLADLGWVESLDLSRSPVTDDGVRALGSMRKLRHLSLRHTRVTGSFAEAFHGHPSLRRLDLPGTRLDNYGVRQLAYLEDLQQLVVGEDLDVGLRHDLEQALELAEVRTW